jgi:hypothetical protein
MSSTQGLMKWNAGAWYGTQIGATIWLLALSILFFPTVRPLAGIFLTCFLVPNIIGYLMWGWRRTLPAYPCYQVLILLIGLSGLVAFLAADFGGYMSLIEPRMGTPRFVYLSLLAFPAIMLFFHFLNFRHQTE